jgi:hypothetical protein
LRPAERDVADSFAQSFANRRKHGRPDFQLEVRALATESKIEFATARFLQGHGNDTSPLRPFISNPSHRGAHRSHRGVHSGLSEHIAYYAVLVYQHKAIQVTPQIHVDVRKLPDGDGLRPGGLRESVKGRSDEGTASKDAASYGETARRTSDAHSSDALSRDDIVAVH